MIARVCLYSGEFYADAALGRLGGLKGGKARIAQLSPEERRELARKAVQARWAKEKARKNKT